jgi:hypothetical protein
MVWAAVGSDTQYWRGRREKIEIVAQGMDRVVVDKISGGRNISANSARA